MMDPNEKERLMNEILKKDRSKIETVSTKPVTLTTDPVYTKQAKNTTSEILSSATKTTGDLLKKADSAFDSLRDILNRQQKELNQMSRDNGFNAKDMEAMQKEIERDYGVTNEAPHAKTAVIVDTDSAFRDIETELLDRIVGNDDAMKQLCVAFKRPYVMGESEGKAKNVILVTGPKGSGKHESIRQIAASMKDHHLIESDEVAMLDMSLYNASSQEQIFLQDLYKVLSGNGKIVCFENFEVGFPAFLRMIDALVCDGKTVLNKRYVLSKGILVENQTGLVKNTVDSLSAEGKYFVFITTKGTSSLQDAFGANFLYHVLDVVTLTKFTDENAMEYTTRKTNEFIAKAKQFLKLNVTEDPGFKEWVIHHYDKNTGADALNALFNDYYISLSQEVLASSVPSSVPTTLMIENDTPVARIGAVSVKLSRSKTSAEEIEQINQEIDGIVGLDTIKTYIRSLQSHIQMNEIRKQQGMKVAEVSKHMIFTGNPGTGKTTIARLISRYMKAIGALSQGQLVEVTRADLVAQYVGQTAPLTMSVIKSALGGVLFIDEAYSLYRGKDDTFGLECIDTIVKAMEDNRDNLIVILAGYKKEMSTFLEANSGLKSRFPNIIDFPDYTADELQKIAILQAKSKGYTINEDALPALNAYFAKVQLINAAEAGNGRLSRNTIEDAILRQSQRLVKHPEMKIDELLLEDFNLTVNVKPDEDAELTPEQIAMLAALMGNQE